MDPSSPEVSEEIKIYAGIGVVCLQWARLEMMLLGVIYSIEMLDPEKGELIFSGQDMLPRINMAVKLAEHAKLPLSLQKRIMDIRKQLQGKGNYDGLAARRNQIVHGAHRDIESGSTTLTMTRWRGEKRDKTFTAFDINDLAVELFELGNEAHALSEAIWDWHLSDHSRDDKSGQLPER